MGGVIFLSSGSLATNSFGQIPATLPETVIAGLPASNTRFHDVVINCDMLETDIVTEDTLGSTLKAIVWDNGEHMLYTGGASESWLYVEDPRGNRVTLSLGTNIRQPDVVISEFANSPGDYIIAVVYVDENINPGYTGRVYIQTFSVQNTGTPALAIAPLGLQALSGSVWLQDGSEGNPHIDMWTDPTQPVNSLGLPSLREVAVSWTQGYNYTPDWDTFIVFNHWYIDESTNPPDTVYFYDTTYALVGATCAPSNLYYAFGDIFNLPGVAINQTFLDSCTNMADIACYTDVTTGQQEVAIVYNPLDFFQCFPYAMASQGLYVLDIDPAGGTPPNSTFLSSTPAVLNRIEAMSQYDPNIGMLNWEVAAAQNGQVYGYNEIAGSISIEHLSVNYSAVDNKSPAVAAGIGPLFGGNIGNRQYTAGYRPADYSLPCKNYPNIYSRGIDVFSGVVTPKDYQVNTNQVCYPWDVNRAYAVSSSSNTGLNLLSAYFNGRYIVYKVSPNTLPMVYKTTHVGSALVNEALISAYPNPASDKLYIKNAKEDAAYEISDMTGRILQQAVTQGSNIDINEFAPGFYLLRINAQTIKFTKQ